MAEQDGKLKAVPDNTSVGDAPGPILNDELVKADDHHTVLIEGLREGEQFKILSEGSWKYLSKLYGELASYASENYVHKVLLLCFINLHTW